MFDSAILSHNIKKHRINKKMSQSELAELLFVSSQAISKWERGLSVAGNAAYVAGAVRYANSVGCLTVGITSNAGSLMDTLPDISIVPDTGAEVVTGSTRMKAGTAQKIILNMISTSVMIKCGYVYENLMINLKPTNKKLTYRMITIVCDILGVGEQEAEKLLEENDWNIKTAVESTIQM